MKREELIKKWLDNNLNTEEQNAFEQLEGYNDLIKMDATLKGFKAPEFSINQSYEALKPKLKPEQSASKQWLKPLLRIAAVLAIALSVYMYTSNLDTEVNTIIAEQTTIALPDNSTVELNANSSLSFNENNWSDHREVKLNGEVVEYGYFFAPTNNLIGEDALDQITDIENVEKGHYLYWVGDDSWLDEYGVKGAGYQLEYEDKIDFIYLTTV